jgi:hypothetical protein
MSGSSPLSSRCMMATSSRLLQNTMARVTFSSAAGGSNWGEVGWMVQRARLVGGCCFSSRECAQGAREADSSKGRAMCGQQPKDQFSLLTACVARHLGRGLGRLKVLKVVAQHSGEDRHLGLLEGGGGLGVGGLRVDWCVGEKVGAGAAPKWTHSICPVFPPVAAACLPTCSRSTICWYSGSLPRLRIGLPPPALP